MKREEIPLIRSLYPALMVLFSGAYAGISNKVMYKMDVEGRHGQRNDFEKPFFFTLAMFVGEAMCLLYYWLETWWVKRFGKTEGEKTPLLEGVNVTAAATGVTDLSSPTGATPHAGSTNTVLPSLPVASPAPAAASAVDKPRERVPVWYFAGLSVFDLTATTLGGIGLKWVSASANQMLRGSMILFTAIWSLIILGKNPSLGKWGGIAIVCLGLVLVGVSSVLRGDSGVDASTLQLIMGPVLVVLGSAINAAQGVIEEMLMKDREAHPLEVVGWEGVFGCIWSSFIMLPIVQAIGAEDSIDTLYMFANSAAIAAMLIGYCVSLAVMNNYSQVVSKYLSAVHRMLVNTLRVVLVWLVDLLITYAFHAREYGESWDNWSFLQLGGFLFLCAGTAVYVVMPPRPDPVALLAAQMEKDKLLDSLGSNGASAGAAAGALGGAGGSAPDLRGSVQTTEPLVIHMPHQESKDQDAPVVRPPSYKPPAPVPLTNPGRPAL
jgi:drug/metabolite transporter (DMT)-like permease